MLKPAGTHCLEFPNGKGIGWDGGWVYDFRFTSFLRLLGETPRLLDVDAPVFGERALCKNSVLEYKPQYFK